MDQYIILKSSRVYYGGLGYRGIPPTSRVVAQQMADYLTLDNPVGFHILPYQPEVINHLDSEKVDLYNPK